LAPSPIFYPNVYFFSNKEASLMALMARAAESSPLFEFLVADEHSSHYSEFFIFFSIFMEFLLIIGIFLKDPLILSIF